MVDAPTHFRVVQPVKEHIVGSYESRSGRCIKNMRRPAECHCAIRLRTGWQWGVPAITDGKVAREEIRDWNCRSLEKSHRIGLLSRMCVSEFSVGLNETIHRKSTCHYRL